MNNKRILIFSGGNLGPWALAAVEPGDFLLGVDRGALYLLEQGHRPDYALGDFDSVSAEELQRIRQESKHLASCDPILKDETDTELAFNWALEQHPREIILLGVLGTRFDHSLANVHLLARALQQGVPCRILDEHNEILLMDQSTTITANHFPQISLLPLNQEVTGVTLTGFRYPLNNATLTLGQSIGISNLLVGERGKIEITSGQLLVIRSRD